jgi:hypothetical protein
MRDARVKNTRHHHHHLMTMTTTATTTTTAQTLLAGPARPDARYWDCPVLDSAEHVSEALGEALELPASVDADRWATEQEDALCRWFARLTHNRYEQVVRDNTYNQENDLSAEFVFSVFAPEGCSDWVWSDDVFVVVENHLGGDVRGNYGPMAVYRVDRLGETGFFDLVCGWHASPINPDSVSYLADSECRELQAVNDRLLIGYSSHPTFELRNLLMDGCEPVWVERLGCYVARLADVPFAVRLDVVGPSYGV